MIKPSRMDICRRWLTLILPALRHFEDQGMRAVYLPVYMATGEAQASPAVMAGVHHAGQQQRPRQHKGFWERRVSCSGCQQGMHAPGDQDLVAVLLNRANTRLLISLLQGQSSVKRSRDAAETCYLAGCSIIV